MVDQSQDRKQSRGEKELLFRPFGAGLRPALFTRGLRRGLNSSAASRLRSGRNWSRVIDKMCSDAQAGSHALSRQSRQIDLGSVYQAKKHYAVDTKRSFEASQPQKENPLAAD